MSSENRNPNTNKKRRASSPDEFVKRIRLPRSSVAASAVSIEATSANASHGSTNRVGSNSNKRAREEQSVPSSKRARVTPLLPLDLPFTLAPPAPRVPKSNKLSAEEVPIFGHRCTKQQLQVAAAALIALAKQAQNINKRAAIDEAVVLPGGKRIRIEVPVISSNNNGIGRPRHNRRRNNNVAGPIPIWNLRTASAPTTAPAPAPTEATAATSAATATAGNQAASSDYYISSSDESSVSSDDESLSGMALLSGMPGASSPGQQSAPSTSSWDDSYSNPDVDMPDINTDDETSLAGINLLPAIDEGKSVIKIQANVRGYIVRNLKPRAAPQADSDANGGGGQEQEWDGNLNDVSSLSEDEEWSGEEDDNAVIQSVLKVAPAYTGDDNDEEDEKPSNMDDDGQESVNFDAAGYDIEDDDTMGSNPRSEFDSAAMDAPEMDVDDDGQDSVNFDVASNASESNNTEAIEEEEDEDEDVIDEEEEVEAVQPVLRRRPRMLAELQSTLDGWYWRQATTRRFIDRN